MVHILSKCLSVQVFRYVIVGVFNTLFSYGVYSLMVFIGLGYRAASLISIVVGVFFSYVTQGSVVFNGMSRASFVKYAFSWAALYVVNIWIISVCIGFSFNAYQAGAIATVPVVILGFFVMKYFVFRSMSPKIEVK
ncbi:MAG: GtrA family protein [Rhodocyclaceae bacterium]|nr:GtrA family protein [Rhodocyclaceae bacterium]